MKTFILVAGTDYHPLSEGKAGTNFINYCTKYIDKILPTYPKNEDLSFYLIDIKSGSIKLRQYVYDANTLVRTKTESIHATYDPVVKANYSDLKGDGKLYFHPKGKNIISKWTVYALVETIGTTQPGTLEELGIFSHAYWDGPILVNSIVEASDYTDHVDGTTVVPVRTLGYDPNDFDCRRNDLPFFYGWLHPTDRLVNFKAAFSATGVVKVWGCNFLKTINRISSVIRRNAAYKSSGLTDTDIFTFAPYAFMKDDKTTDPNGDLVQFNAIAGTAFKRNETITMEFLLIKQFFCRLMLASYAHSIAKTIDRNVLAALPGTYADISPIFKINSDTLPTVRMLKTYLNLDISADGLNYGIYKPDQVCP